MNFHLFLTASAIAFANVAQAQSRIDDLCGADHVNELVSADDIVANPDGYYIRSLETQLSHGDPRLVTATGERFHLCTRSAATPEMDKNRLLLLVGERRVKYLFVPVEGTQGKPSS